MCIRDRKNTLAFTRDQKLVASYLENYSGNYDDATDSRWWHSVKVGLGAASASVLRECGPSSGFEGTIVEFGPSPKLGSAQYNLHSALTIADAAYYQILSA